MKIKKLIAVMFAAMVAVGAQAQSLSDLLGKLGSGKGQDVLSAIGNAVASDKFDLNQLNGTYVYESPALSFKSDETLANLGGSAMATQVENKLAPYFKKAGLSGLSMTFDGNCNFVAKIKNKEAKGHIARDTETNEIYFYFDRNGKTSDKGVKAMVTKVGDKVNITLDASKALEFAKKISSSLNISYLKTASAMLSKYKDAYVGVRVAKQ